MEYFLPETNDSEPTTSIWISKTAKLSATLLWFFRCSRAYDDIDPDDDLPFDPTQFDDFFDDGDGG